MKHSFDLHLSREEEEQLQELTKLYTERQRQNGKEPDGSETKNVLSTWVYLGLASQMAKNFEFLKGNFQEQIRRGGAA